MPARKLSRKRLPRPAATHIRRRPTVPGSRSPVTKAQAARQRPRTVSRPRAGAKHSSPVPNPMQRVKLHRGAGTYRPRISALRRWRGALRYVEATNARSMPLEILHIAFMLLGGRARLERAEIAALAGLRIDLAGVETVSA